MVGKHLYIFCNVGERPNSTILTESGHNCFHKFTVQEPLHGKMESNLKAIGKKICSFSLGSCLLGFGDVAV